MKKFIIFLSLLLISSLGFAQDFYDTDTINTIEITFAEANWESILMSYYNQGDEERLLATALINGTFYDSVGVRFKGNSSCSSSHEKNPFNIKLDYIIEDQEIGDYGTLKLSNVYKDPSFVRETLGYEIAAKYSPASKANYINVYVNEELIGLYTNVQSVDKEFLRSFFSDDENPFFKGNPVGGPGGGSSNLAYLGADSTNYYDSYELKSDYGWQEMVDLCYTLNNNTSMIEDNLDVDRALWLLAFHNTLVSNDSPIMAPHNFYLYMDKNDQFNYIYWDLNMTFGTFSGGQGSSQMSLTDLQHMDPLYNINNNSYPIVSKLLSIPEYQKIYISHMKTILEDNFSNGWYQTRAAELQELIDSSVQADQKKFYSYEDFINNIDSSISGSGSSFIVGITELMEERTDFLLNHELFDVVEPLISEISTNPIDVEANSTFDITIISENTDILKIGYRENEFDKFEKMEMYDDGEHNDQLANDGIFGITLTANYNDIQYYIMAENDNAVSLSPQHAEFEYHTIDIATETGELVINEINYNSSDDFNTEDWVELYNPGSTDLNISGWVFKDEDDAHSFIIPDYTVLPANGYIVLCNDAAAFSALFPDITNIVGDLGFGFSGSGELIRIFDGDGLLIDSVEYGDDAPWPEEADGNGASIELIDYQLDNNLASSWQASIEHGTPGQQNDASVYAEDDQVDALPSAMGNYPNPFNPTTTISFTLTTESSENTELVIYNAKGQKVKTLINENLRAGSHNVEWNGKDENNNPVSSGIYFYKLKSSTINQTKKMLLMK